MAATSVLRAADFKAMAASPSLSWQAGWLGSHPWLQREVDEPTGRGRRERARWRVQLCTQHLCSWRREPEVGPEASQGLLMRGRAETYSPSVCELPGLSSVAH